MSVSVSTELVAAEQTSKAKMDLVYSFMFVNRNKSSRQGNTVRISEFK